MKNNDSPEKKFKRSDPIDSYFECISICDLKDCNCISMWVEILKHSED